jgi:hypothetical protein
MLTMAGVERHLRLRTVSLRYAVTSSLYQLDGRHRSWFEDLRDRYRGQPMLIAGNGPSLLRTPLDQMAGVASIGMNKIDLLFPKTSWRPQFIVCTNSMVVRQHRDSFERSAIPVLLPYKSRRLVRGRRNPLIQFFNLHASPQFSTDFPRGIGRSPTVTYAALQLAYHLGADPVVLVGVDHNFTGVGGPANTYVRADGQDPNHFDPNYFGPGMLWGLPDLEGSEIVYRLARRAFETAGRRVLDATVDGRLQIFQKIDMRSALEVLGGRQPAEEALAVASGG